MARLVAILENGGCVS